MARPKLPTLESVLPAFQTVMSTGAMTKGQQLEAFERECAHYLEVEHCVGVSSCTSGLMLAFQALKLERPAGTGRIAVPSFTFMASLSSLCWAGFEPVFIDTDPGSMNLCLDDLEQVLNSQEVDAVLAVHCFGNPVPQSRLEALCKEAGARLIYDSAHAFGSMHDGDKVGSSGWCQVYSLTPTKMVVAGEGGIVATNDAALAETLKLGREYGNDGSYGSNFPGLNARLSEIHAAIGRESLKMLEGIVAERNELACNLMGQLGSISGVGFQTISEGSRTTYKDFTVTIDEEAFGCDRDTVAWALALEGIPSRAYFSPPCHLHRAYRRFHSRPLPKTERLSSQTLALPMFDKSHAPLFREALMRIQAHASTVKERYRAESCLA